MRRTAALLAAGAALAAVPAQAETLREALVKAYGTNPTLTASRAGQRATDETVPIARAAGRPGVNLTGGASENPLNTGNSFSNPERQLTSTLGVTVPLYSGGAVRNSVRGAETRVEAGRAGLRGTEASLFTEVVGAYNDVLRDEAIVGLNTQNVRVLETNLRATQDRFQVGDLTRTDVAQSEARLSLARAQLQTAQARLISSKENYVRLVGAAPVALEAPPPLPGLPDSPDAAVEVALRDNPTLLAAVRTRDATAYDIRVAQASRLPQVGVTVGGTYNNFLGTLGGGATVVQPGQGVTAVPQSGVSGGLGLNLTLPIFQGGRPAALIRQAQALRGQAIEQVTETERQVIATTRSAYAIWQSSLQVIRSSEQAVSANKLSLEGVRAENSVGNRTILDILNAEQELLNSQVTLVTARRDAYVAGFALLAAMGEAEARDLNLEGGRLYDPVENFRDVRGRYSDFGRSPAAEAVAPSTRETPAQNASVRRQTDPALNSAVDRSAPLTNGESTPRP